MDEYGGYEEYEEYEDEDEDEVTPRKRSGLIVPLTGGTLLTTEIIGAMIHGGPLAVGAGLLASGFVYLKGQEILDVVQGILPQHYVEDKKTRSETTSGRSVKDRLLGRHPEESESTLDRMEDLQPKPTGGALPRRSPRFAQMRHLIAPDMDILGFDGKRFISAKSLQQSVNIGLIGVPGAGKTSCLTFFVGQAVCRNAIVRGWDLHGDVAADLGSFFNILEEVDEILDDCEWLQQERDRRLALRKKARARDKQALREWNQTRELFYIVDELNALMLRLKNRKADRDLVTDTLLSLIAEGRKFKMRVILGGQTMPAALFGEGGSGTVDLINTKYAFQSRERQVQYIGIEQEAIEKLLPLISGADSAGYAILDGGSLLRATIVSIPLTTVEDIRALLAEGNYQLEDEDEEDEDWWGNAETPGSGGNGPGNAGGSTVNRLVAPFERHSGNNVMAFPEHAKNPRKQAKMPGFDEGNAETQAPLPLPDGVTWNQLHQIQGAYEAGWPLRDIAQLVKMDGRRYAKFKAACEYLGIDPRAKA